MPAFEQFMQSFGRLEDALGRLARSQGEAASVARLLSEARERSRVIREHFEFLDKVRELRNVLVHRRQDGAALAEPTEAVLARLDAIVELLLRPPRLPAGLRRQIRVLDADQPLGEILRFMEENRYSQVPIADGGELAALLTTNSVALWLARNVKEEIVDIAHTPVREVLDAGEGRAEYTVQDVQTDCEAVIDLFSTAKYRPQFPASGFDSLEQARRWASNFVYWYNLEHLHSGIRYVSPEARHQGHDKAILAARHDLYLQARRRNPQRWTRQTRNWAPIDVVTLNPERDSIVRQAAHTQPLAA